VQLSERGVEVVSPFVPWALISMQELGDLYKEIKRLESLLRRNGISYK
jgi:hypothetical protein